MSVIGIGNPLRHDDAIGIILLHFLKQNEEDFSSKVAFIDGGTGGMNVLHLILEYDTVLIIDAVQHGGKPGQWSFFSSDDVVSQKQQEHISTHISDVFQVILLAKEISQKPNNVFVFGIEPQDLSFGEGLSESLTNHLPELQKQLKEKLHWMSDTFLLK